jgi:hypothetical protein
MCIQVHYVFYYILSEIEQIYYDESGHPFVNED